MRKEDDIVLKSGKSFRVRSLSFRTQVYVATRLTKLSAVAVLKSGSLEPLKAGGIAEVLDSAQVANGLAAFLESNLESDEINDFIEKVLLESILIPRGFQLDDLAGDFFEAFELLFEILKFNFSEKFEEIQKKILDFTKSTEKPSNPE